MKRLSGLKKSEFLKNATTLISGTILAQVITILTAPILTRLYLPEHYGVFGIFVAITTLLGILSTFQYSTAIILPQKDEDAICLLKSSVLITIMVSVVILIVVLFLSNFFSNLISTKGLTTEIFLMPMSVICIGLNASFVALGNRHKKYRIISTNRVVSSIAGATTSFIYFWLFGADSIGLILGYLVGQIISSIFLFISITTHIHIRLFENYNFREMYLVLKRYVNFPKYSLVTDFINGLINQLPIFLLAKLSGRTSVGYYNMSNRMLGLPVITISSGFSEVFRQRASHDYNIHGNCIEVFKKTAKSLTLISILPFIGIILFGAEIFAVVFGENWRTAGIYSQIMGLMFFFRFIVSPLTFVYYIRGKQREDFFLHILMVVFGLLSLYIGYMIYNSAEKMLFFYSISYSIIYIIYFFRSYQLAKGNINE